MKSTTEIAPNVDLIELDGKKIFLVGTAHISRASTELVSQTIEQTKPDSVCVELCESRAQVINNPERWRDTDVFAIIRSGKTYVLLTQLILASFQRRLAQRFDLNPGDEMRSALAAAKTHGASVAYVDRDIRITLKRAWAKAKIFSMLKVSGSLLLSLFSDEEISEQQIEELKKGDALLAMMAEFSTYLPEVKNVLIDERDQYLAAKIAQTPGNTVVAVVGAGHVPGIKQAIDQPIDLASLEKLPPKSRALSAIGWAISLVVLGTLVYGFVTLDQQAIMKMVSWWVLITGGLAAIATACALAHPLSVLTAFVSAPFTTLHPALAAGWFAGLVEAVVRKPRVRDLEKVSEDVTTLRGFWSNRVTKVLLVVAFANLGASAGTLFGWFKVSSLLGWL